MPPRRQHGQGGYCSSPYTSRSVFRDSLEYQKLQLLAQESRLRTKVHQKTLIQLRRPYFCRMERQVGGYVLFQTAYFIDKDPRPEFGNSGVVGPRWRG